MGVVSDEVVEVTVVEKGTRRKMRKKDAAEGGGDGLVTWERFLPKIPPERLISALLRKCSYRVAAVPYLRA